MDQSNLRKEMSENLHRLQGDKFPRGGAHLPGMDDAIVELAELDGFVVGLVDSFLHNAPLRSGRIALSRALASTLIESRSSQEEDATLEPYRRRWKQLIHLSELLAKTGEVRLDWVD